MENIEGLLQQFGISSKQSAESIVDALGVKQMEYLERLDNVEDEARKEQLKRELQLIETAIVTVSKGDWQSVTGMRRDTVKEEILKDLKQQEAEEEKETLQAESDDAFEEFEEFEAVEEIYHEDIEKGFPLMLALAEQGNVFAQCEMGFYYSFGKYCEKDYKKAIEWYEKAAENGHTCAQHNLARYYLEGIEVEKDEKKAVALYREAAEGDFENSQFALGSLYLTGRAGLEKDKDEAMKWIKKAAYQKYEKAIQAVAAFGIRP